MPIYSRTSSLYHRIAALVAIAALAAACGRPANGPVPVPDGDWPAYGRDALGSRFSPLTQIDRSNVSRLTRAWTFHTGEPLPTSNAKRSLEVTPLVADGVMYIATPLGKVIALDPVTGTEKWRYDAQVNTTARFGDFTTRGVSLWRDRVVYATTDGRLISLDRTTGRLVESFGDRGTVDLRAKLRNAPRNFTEYEVTSPPAIVNDMTSWAQALPTTAARMRQAAKCAATMR